MEKEEYLIRPSLLSSSFLSLQDDIEEMISLNIKSCHYDVMDGTFVEQISFGQPILKSILKTYKDRINFDVHLMTINPLKQVNSFLELGSRDITFHYEVIADDLNSYINLKKEYPDLKLGIAISPETEEKKIFSILKYFDSVLVMSVVPGKGGQKYIEGSEDKIKNLSTFRKDNNLNFIIGVDGGINEKTGALCHKNGADYLVCGSYYFKASDRHIPLLDLHREIEKYATN